MSLLTNVNDPGFVDAHVHIRGADALATIRAAGIAAVRDAGMRENVSKEVPSRKAGTHAPLVISCGWALSKKGGYGSLFGAPVDTREEIATEILKLKRAGAGIIKVMASGAVSLKKPDTITPGGFGQDELAFIVSEAAAVGLRVMAHANGEAAIIAATKAGVCSIEHGFFMTERALELMAKHGTYWTPTVGALKRAAKPDTTSKEMKHSIAGLIRSHLEMIRKAYEMNVLLAVGTDCVLPDPDYKKAYEAELSHFEQAGIPYDAVIKIACEGGRKLLGIK
jgi:imidazolonepropionase-like amidohydrolase